MTISPFGTLGNDAGSMPSFDQLASFSASGSGNSNSGGIDWGKIFGNGDGQLGFNMDTLQLGLGGIQTLGNLWNAFQAQQLAREQFDYTKGITDTNLGNSITSYNTSLSDRIRARAAAEGQGQSYIDDYLNANRAVDSRNTNSSGSPTNPNDPNKRVY